MTQNPEAIEANSEQRKKAKELFYQKANLLQERLAKEPELIESLLEELQVHQIKLELQNEELRQAQAQLEKSREDYFHLYEIAPVGYLTLDRRGIILRINLRGAEIIGKARSLLLNSALTPFLESEDQDGFYRFTQQCLKTQTPIRYDLRLKHEAGNPRWIELDGIAHEDPEIGEAQLYITMSDITEQKNAAEDKHQLQAQLYQFQKMESLGTLAGGIAHDFNNLLVPILNLTQRVQNQLPAESEAFNNLKRVYQAAEQAKDLVAQILIFSRKSEVQREPIALEHILRDMMRFLLPTLPSNITLRHTLDFDCPSIEGDPKLIYQALVNLSVNAVQGMPQGGTIAFYLQNTGHRRFANSQGQPVEGEFVCLKVEDTGQGMDASTLERIFEPFFTTQEVDQGIGLGLSVVLGIMKQHEGHIEVESEVGKGTTFCLYFPVSETPNKEAETDEGIVDGEGRILLVDDRLMVLETGVLLLKDMGYHVSSYTEAQKTWEVFQADPQAFDLLITDYSMPGMNGLELAKKVKALRPDFPVILCTGHNNNVTKANIREWNLDGLIIKPYDPTELSRVVQQVLTQKDS